MKKLLQAQLLLIAIIFFAPGVSRGQFVLEHDYDSSSQQLKYVNFRFNGEKYVRTSFPRTSGGGASSVITPEIDIYNLNHSLWKTIPLAGLPRNPDNATLSTSYGLLYISDGLFNKDSLVEFLFTTAEQVIINGSSTTRFETYVFNENLELLFRDSIAGPWYSNLEVPQTYLPIVNTSQGTKMILNGGPSNVARVYGLAGLLTTVAEPNGSGNSKDDEGFFKLFPNPSSNQVTVQYQLPADIATAQLVFYDVAGNRVKQFTVDHSFGDLLLSTADLAAGTYYCRVETAKGSLSGKKMIKIE